jgi:hypothetical protein
MQKRSVFAGRIEEITSSSSVGKGQELVTKLEQNKAPRHIRHGIRKRAVERHAAQADMVCFLAALINTVLRTMIRDYAGKTTREFPSSCEAFSAKQ